MFVHQQEHFVSDNIEKFLSGPEVDKRYGRSAQTRWRWCRDPALGFPKPIRIKNRLFFRLRDLVEWERRMASQLSQQLAEMAA